jgi:hypothetical protein
MLETYSLKKHLEDVRQELAHALYQHDAACRVIARLIKERDAARRSVRVGHQQTCFPSPLTCVAVRVQCFGRHSGEHERRRTAETRRQRLGGSDGDRGR